MTNDGKAESPGFNEAVISDLAARAEEVFQDRQSEVLLLAHLKGIKYFALFLKALLPILLAGLLLRKALGQVDQVLYKKGQHRLVFAVFEKDQVF